MMNALAMHEGGEGGRHTRPWRCQSNEGSAKYEYLGHACSALGKTALNLLYATHVASSLPRSAGVATTVSSPSLPRPSPLLNVYGLCCKLALLMFAVVAAAPSPLPPSSASRVAAAAAVASFGLLMCQLSEYLKSR